MGDIIDKQWQFTSAKIMTFFSSCFSSATLLFNFSSNFKSSRNESKRFTCSSSLEMQEENTHCTVVWNHKYSTKAIALSLTYHTFSQNTYGGVDRMLWWQEVWWNASRPNLPQIFDTKTLPCTFLLVCSGTAACNLLHQKLWSNLNCHNRAWWLYVSQRTHNLMQKREDSWPAEIFAEYFNLSCLILFWQFSFFFKICQWKERSVLLATPWN